MIRGLLLVSAQFDENSQPVQYCIESIDRITDPKKYIGNTKLLRDDATFNAAVTGLSAFSVIYSGTLPFYRIQDTREKTDKPSATLANSCSKDHPHNDS
jgi:hypothetical protein